MRILHSIPSIDPFRGGPSRAILEIARMSAHDGIEVTVVFGAHPKESRYVDDIRSAMPSIKLLPFPYSFPKRYSASAQMEDWLGNNLQEFDLVHIHSVYSLTSVRTAQLAARQNVPYVIRPAGSLDPFDLRKKRILKYMIAQSLINGILAGASSIHCTSEQEANGLQLFGSSPNVSVLPLPVSTGQHLGKGDRFRLKHKIPETDFVWLFMSRLDYKKGLNFLIPAMHALSKVHPDAKLVIVGAALDRYDSTVKGWVRRFGLEAKVLFCGFLGGEDKLDALAASDCFVLPSMYENFGISVVEALAASLPVLVSKNVYIWKEVLDYGGGWACEYSQGAITDAMMQIMDRRGELQSRKALALKAAEQFSPETLASSYRAFYEEIIRLRHSI